MAGVAKVRGVFCAESRDWFGGLGILSVYVVLGGSVRGVCVYCPRGWGAWWSRSGGGITEHSFFSCVGGAAQAGPPSPPCGVFTQIFVFHGQLALLS